MVIIISKVELNNWWGKWLIINVVINIFIGALIIIIAVINIDLLILMLELINMVGIYMVMV